MASVQDRLRTALTISTAPGASSKKGHGVNPVGIKKVTEWEFAKRYKMGQQVMESTNAGMDVVQAVRLEDGLPVVIKTRQRPGSFKTPEVERDWRRTTEVQLGMPQTCRLCEYFEVLETDKCYFVIMEKVEGKDLFEVISEARPAREEARDIVRQILEALDVLHSHGRIHKDLKIENVMVDLSASGSSVVSQQRRTPESAAASRTRSFGASPATTKLIDFDTVEDWEPSSPSAKEVLGTDGYIAPEAYLGQYSPASDVYAAGVVMYKVLVGEFPTREEIFDDEPGENWVGSPSMKRIYARLQKEVIDFTKPPFDKDVLAADLCCKLLAFEAIDRPSAADALKNAWFYEEPR
mmetsp:Transcript_165877/g.532567  ORF Transcript_165877/g.532567 Transcript_165877/m.532567 type:complete len:351 (-) Transcript_165877:40-1092(-)|eukprot:CAMPEP_0203867874 /NCGR_PEP_ID=MMETSP0359-20131031/16781_1 /ASSEMBLY_ACC=CAM_ASM_000338 /TAXON_ID=268821 /ORGANISM="Scrippsiella Hangoei, Strain SHTV-5" /LENGTH=350 /DNA_ID=CAMNT_0050786201 /DNA_START=154 /DNA_END=1206 /DNA_ORIENTATION=+